MNILGVLIVGMKLSLISTGVKVTRYISPYEGKMIYVDKFDNNDRYVLCEYCKCEIRGGKLCPNLQSKGRGYCSRHWKKVEKDNPPLPVPKEMVTVINSGERTKIKGHFGATMWHNKLDANERYILIRLCKATTKNGDMCTNLRNAIQGYCYTHWGMIQRGTLEIATPETPEKDYSQESSEESSE